MRLKVVIRFQHRLGKDECNSNATHDISCPDGKSDAYRAAYLKFPWIRCCETDGSKYEYPENEDVDIFAERQQPFCGPIWHERSKVRRNGIIDIQRARRLQQSPSLC